MFCSKCGRPVDDGAAFCSHCGSPLSSGAAAPAVIPDDPAGIAARVRRNETVISVLWLALGVVQLALLYTAAAGVWNIVNAILTLRNTRNIVAGNPNVVPYFDGKRTGLIVMGVVNLVLGGVVGVALVLYELHIRQVVLDNAGAFDAGAAPVAAEKARADAAARGERIVSVPCPGCGETFSVKYRPRAGAGDVLKFTCPKCKTKTDVDLSGLS